MKKLLSILVTSFAMNLFASHGGDVAGGVAAGLIGGALISSAVSHDGRSRRAEEDARDAQRKVDQLKAEQQQEKFADLKQKLERDELLRQQEAMLKQQQEIAALEKSNRNLIIFIILAGFLLLFVIGMVIARNRGML